jgi:hypothetical protein
MNKRIKELAEQAETKEIGYYFFDREKFAQLIIKECAEVAGCNAHVSGFALGDLIKEHFQ